MTSPEDPAPDPPRPASDAELDDPDLRAMQDQTDPAEDPSDLSTDDLRPESEVVEYEPPFTPSTPTRRRTTEADERRGETIEERLPEEDRRERPPPR